MAFKKDPNGELQTAKILFNCTPTFKRQVQALAKLERCPMNQVVADAVAAVISTRRNEIERALQLEAEYAQKFSELTLNFPPN